jgi:heptaprenylglyceryl phosphate synthase
VQRFVASGAQSDQVQIVVVALLASQFLVVYLEISSGTTDLASPAIAPQYLISQLVIRFGIKTQAGLLGSN